MTTVQAAHVISLDFLITNMRIFSSLLQAISIMLRTFVHDDIRLWRLRELSQVRESFGMSISNNPFIIPLRDKNVKREVLMCLKTPSELLQMLYDLMMKHKKAICLMSFHCFDAEHLNIFWLYPLKTLTFTIFKILSYLLATMEIQSHMLNETRASSPLYKTFMKSKAELPLEYRLSRTFPILSTSGNKSWWPF